MSIEFYNVLLFEIRDRVFACGTHAFNPKCSWRNIEEISRTTKEVDGRAKCPYSPHSNVTAMMTGVNGDYYIATAIDFSSNDPAIYRMSAGGSKGKYYCKTKRPNQLRGIQRLAIESNICHIFSNRIW